MIFAGLGGIVVAYIVGSFPSAYLAGRLLRDIDLRTVGSGNLGATNVYRELGPVAAIVVLAIDVMKGAGPTLLLPGLLGFGMGTELASQWWAVTFGAAAIAGHAKPIFLLWRGGGKGVATAAGVFLSLSPGATSLCIVAFVGIVMGTRYVSLASIIAAAALPICEWFGSGASPVFFASVVVAVFVAYGHRGNIVRLRAGTERRFARSAVERT